MATPTSSDPATPDSAAARPPARPPRRSFRSYFWWSVFGAFVLLALYTMFLLWWSYSEGERAGVLQKFSKRGWVCKTHEGELALYVVGGIAPQIWDFSVRDDAVVDALHQAVGRQVRLHYTEHPGLPTNCFGETRYFVDRVEVVDAPTVVAPSSGLSVVPVERPASPP